MIIRKIVTFFKYLQFRLQKVSIKWSIYNNIELNSNINNKGLKLKIGKTYIRGNVSINTSENGKLIIGDNSFFNKNCIIACRDKIFIGNNCIFGPNVCIYDHDHKYGKNGVELGYNYGEVIIDDNCWIGAGAIILKGTHIRKGPIVAAGAIVKGDFDENVIIYSSNEIKTKSLNKETDWKKI